ncbi:MAG TPA: hypothetical protein VF270_09550 [Ignavibacteriaceae bacterium]
MLNGDKVIRIFCLVDDLLKGIGHQEDVRCRVSDSEVITTAIVSALYLGGHQDNARGFMQMTGMCPQMLGKSLFIRFKINSTTFIKSIFGLKPLFP